MNEHTSVDERRPKDKMTDSGVDAHGRMRPPFDREVLPTDARFRASPARPARAFLDKPTDTDAVQIGDLFPVDDNDDDDNTLVIFAAGFGFCPLALLPRTGDRLPNQLVIVPLVVTDRLTDALSHYRDAFKYLETCYDKANVETRDADSYLRRFALAVRPSDVGFRAAFVRNASDWSLCSQWHSIIVTWHAGAWWITKVNFGNGIEAPLSRESIALYVSAPDRYASLHPLGAFARDLGPVVAGYRATLATGEVAILVFHTPLELDVSIDGLVRLGIDLSRRLAPLAWRPVAAAAAAPTERGSGSVLAGRFTMPIVGPLKNRNAERFVQALSDSVYALLASASAPVLPGPLLCDIVFTDSDISAYDYDSLIDGCIEQYCRLIPHRTRPGRAFVGALADPACQWRAVHRFLLDRALALAPLALPTYVLLWLLEWLPEMRYHVHIQAVRLLEAVRASVQRVLGTRPGSGTE